MCDLLRSSWRTGSIRGCAKARGFLFFCHADSTVLTICRKHNVSCCPSMPPVAVLQKHRDSSYRHLAYTCGARWVDTSVIEHGRRFHHPRLASCGANGLSLLKGTRLARISSRLPATVRCPFSALVLPLAYLVCAVCALFMVMCSSHVGALFSPLLRPQVCSELRPAVDISCAAPSTVKEIAMA